jgi:hypothetical protein
MTAGPRFGRRRLLRNAADAVVRRFVQLSGAEGSEALLRSAPPRPATDSGADPDNPPQLCPGILCTPVSCTGCACGGNLYHCVGCGRNYVACLAGRGCRTFCLRPVC